MIGTNYAIFSYMWNYFYQNLNAIFQENLKNLIGKIFISGSRNSFSKVRVVHQLAAAKLEVP